MQSPPFWVEGPSPAFNGAMEFGHGANFIPEAQNLQTMGSNLKIADEPRLRLADQSFTPGAWVKMSGDPSTYARGYKHVFSKGADGLTRPGWGLFLSSQPPNERWLLNFLIADTEGNGERVTAASEGFTPGDWHHIGLSFDDKTGEVRM